MPPTPNTILNDSIFFHFFSIYWSSGIDVRFGLAPLRDSNILGRFIYTKSWFFLGVAVPGFLFLRMPFTLLTVGALLTIGVPGLIFIDIYPL